MAQDANRATAPHNAEPSRAATSSHSGKEHDADVPRVSLATNGNANGKPNSPKDQDMKDNHADDPGHEAVSIETTEPLSSIISHYTTSTDDPSKGNDDENGEDVVEEAAEDTVIY